MKSGGKAHLGVIASALALWTVTGASGVASAQTAPASSSAPPPAIASAPSPVFAIKGFKVLGDDPLASGETTSVLAPFLRNDATLETLQKATAALETAFRNKGFGLHRVALPPQEVGDTVTLEIVKFTINKVTVDGNQLNDEDNIRRSVPELVAGHTPNFKRMAIQTAIANENPNKQIQVGVKESEEPDKIDASITVKETRPWSFSVGLSNAGSPSSGRDRFTVSGGHTNLFNRDHQFNGAYTTSLERVQDVTQLGVTYRIPLYTLGGVVGATYTRSDVVGNFGSFTSTGAGHTFGINYTHYLAPEGGRRSYLTLGLEDKVFDVALINDIPVPGQLARRSRPVSLGYTARMEADTSVLGYNVEFVANSGGGRGNDLLSYQTEDPRITTTQWKALRAGLNYSASLAGNWLWGLRGQFQYSPDVLISGEQFGLGGVSSVRGAKSERPISGDRGVSVSLEVTSPELATGLRAVGFLDAGWLGNNNPNGATKLGSDRLSGVGLGLRYGNGPVSLSLDYGRLLNSSKVALTVNAGSPQKGDDKLYLNLAVRF